MPPTAECPGLSYCKGIHLRAHALQEVDYLILQKQDQGRSHSAVSGEEEVVMWVSAVDTLHSAVCRGLISSPHFLPGVAEHW